MGSNGKPKWKSLFGRSTRRNMNKSKQAAADASPPTEFICPISGSIMSDPVIISSGQTFERISVQVCKDLHFLPPLSDGSLPDFSSVIPNKAVRSTILRWCDSSGVQSPNPPDYYSVESIVRTCIEKSSNNDTSGGKTLEVSELELLKGVHDNPRVYFSHAATELALRHPSNFFSDSEESVILSPSGPSTPLPLATKPACYYSSSSSEIISEESVILGDGNSTCSSSLEIEYVRRLRNVAVHEQEEALIALRKLTRTNEEARISLCTPRILSAIGSLILSKYPMVQISSVAIIVNLSLEKVNKVKIVRSSFVPQLIEILTGGFDEAQEHAAGALFSLSLEDENKTAIGALGALEPLLHALRSESGMTRHDSALALYHLSLMQSNRVKLLKLGAVCILLGLMRSAEMAGSVVLVVCNLAACPEGQSALLDGKAVEVLVGALREGELHSEMTRENVVAGLCLLGQGSLRFKAAAREAGAAEVLRAVEEKGSERAKERAKRVVEIMRGGRSDDEEGDGERGLGASEWLNRTRQRAGLNSTGF